MASGAADGLFRGFYEGCISGCDMGIERRPYHRNCSCALHKSRKGCSQALPNCKKNVSYPMRRSWSEGSLALHAAAFSNQSSPSSSPAVVAGVTGRPHLGSCDHEEEDQFVSFKI